jgi:hypothetical protein
MIVEHRSGVDVFSEAETEVRREAALKRALTTRHKPHVDKSPVNRKKKDDDPLAKKSRRPQST